MPFWDFAFRADDTLVLGRVSAGVPDTVRTGCAHHVTIPMHAGGRISNIAVAAGIALAEAIRQTHIAPVPEVGTNP
ncbi:MAG: TrmH family RNA methyltransferase [Paracoccaceae bacterium]